MPYTAFRGRLVLTHRHTHTHRSDSSTWTTKVIDLPASHVRCHCSSMCLQGDTGC